MLGEGAMSDWTSLYMKNVAHSSNNMAPLALLSFSICMMIGRLLGDGYRMRWGDNNLLVGGSIFAILGALLTIGLLHPIAVIIGTALIGIGLSTIVPIAYSFAGNAPGLQPSVGISIVTTIGYSGFIFGPAIIGFIAEWSGLRTGFTFLTGLFILMMILCLQRAKSNV
jgi:MFS family permease